VLSPEELQEGGKTKDFWEQISYKISCASPKALSKHRHPGSVSLWGGVEVML